VQVAAAKYAQCVATELIVHLQQLESLLREQAESASLEYIGDCDLSNRRDIVEFATEVGAMAASGGYIVVGVDDHGRPSGRVGDAQAKLFDEAVLRDKLGKYLPASVELRAGLHQIGDSWAAVIHVAAHPDGAAVFIADGTFEENGKTKTAFRVGEFFVRHGSKSERPTQDDIKRLREVAVERKGLWLTQMQRVEDAVAEVGNVASAEALQSSDGRIAGYGVVSRIPTARRRLGAALAALAQTGGPLLPECQELAMGSTLIFYNQVVSSVFQATDEIARTLETSGM
jgi:hypothetical protein